MLLTQTVTITKKLWDLIAAFLCLQECYAFHTSCKNVIHTQRLKIVSGSSKSSCSLTQTKLKTRSFNLFADKNISLYMQQQRQKIECILQLAIKLINLWTEGICLSLVSGNISLGGNRINVFSRDRAVQLEPLTRYTFLITLWQWNSQYA